MRRVGGSEGPPKNKPSGVFEAKAKKKTNPLNFHQFYHLQLTTNPPSRKPSDLPKTHTPPPRSPPPRGAKRPKESKWVSTDEGCWGVGGVAPIKKRQTKKKKKKTGVADQRWKKGKN